MGRPTKLTAEVQSRVCEALALGVSIEAAAAHAGVNVSTIHRWVAQAEHDPEGGMFREFREAMTRARDSAEVQYAAVVASAARDGHVGAAQWWLERRRPTQWGRRDTVGAVAEGEQAAPAVDVAPLLERLARSVESRSGTT